MCRPERARAFRRAAAGLVAITLALQLLGGFASAEARVTLIRVYASEQRGTVFEVCRGRFEAPVSDPMNPAYCEGRVAYWSESRWQAYNLARDGRESPAGSEAQKERAPREPAPVATGTAGAAEAPLPSTPYGGSLDPTAVLGVENPLCGDPAQLSARQLRNCQSSGSPEAAYPVGNYGWDIHIESGGFISSLFVPAVSFVLQFFSVVWLVLLMMLKGCLIILGFAFSLSPFTDNRILGELGIGLTRVFNHLTSPWLSALFVVLGGWGLYNGIVRRRTGETLAGMLMALAMMLAAIWVIHAPRDTVGRFAEVVNGASLVAVAAPSSGHIGAPARSYNDAVASVWDQMTEVPFCAMNFSDVRWCMKAKPSEEALQAARDGLDDGDAFTVQLLSVLPGAPMKASVELSEDLSGLFGPAPSIRDLYLRFSPQSGPRDKLWDYYNGEPDDHVGLPLGIGPQLNVGGGSTGAAPEKVAMQGRSGLLTRMVMVVIFTIGLLGGLLLLLWMAMKLMMATATAFVLVLAAPLAMFLPVFGRAGREAFTRWATALLGSIAAKLVYSGLLGIVLLGSSVIGLGLGGSSPTLGLLAVMAFWWAVFLSRERYLAVFQVDPLDDRGTGLYRTLAGGYLGYRIARGATKAVGSFREERRDRSRQRHEEVVSQRRREADRQLDHQARQRLAAATTEAESRQHSRSQVEQEARALREDHEVRGIRESSPALDDAARVRATAKVERLTKLEGQLQASRPQAQADRRLVDRVRANEAAGLPAHGKSEISAARDALREEAHLPASAPEHRWRARAAGEDPASSGGRKAIEESLRATRAAVGAGGGGRIEQVDLHRPRRSGGDQRRPESGLRQGGGARSPGAEPRFDHVTRPKAPRRSRARDWLSR